VNLSVWTSLEALRDFVFRDPAHLAIMRRRREFFDKIDLVNALWWVPAGHLPSLEETEERYAHLEAHGPTPHAFGFQRHFLPPTVAGTSCHVASRIVPLSTDIRDFPRGRRVDRYRCIPDRRSPQ